MRVPRHVPWHRRIPWFVAWRVPWYCHVAVMGLYGTAMAGNNDMALP